MSERIFVVIGHPIGHTMSPFIHKRLFELAKESGDYRVIDVAPDELPVKIKMLNELCGYNITIPNKQAIIPYLDKLDAKAEMYGSVNTVKNGSVREGFTTDPYGFLKALEHAGIEFGGNVVILGSGGVARTFVYEAALAGCNITLAARNINTADKLTEEVQEKVSGAVIKTCLITELDELDIMPDLLINATPVGMHPNSDAAPVSDRIISRSRSVFDAVYNPLETVFIKKAAANGSKALGGMSMLVWQAAAAHEIWDGTVYSNDDISQLIEDSAAELRA